MTQHLEQRDALLEQRHQLAGVGVREAWPPSSREVPSMWRTSSAPRGELREGGREALDEGALARAQLGLGEAAEQHPRAERGGRRRAR